MPLSRPHSTSARVTSASLSGQSALFNAKGVRARAGHFPPPLKQKRDATFRTGLQVGRGWTRSQAA